MRTDYAFDRLAPLAVSDRVPLECEPPAATTRPPIDTTISTGIRAIDGLLTCGRGQRIGIFSGSGVGKSVTLGMMAQYTSADVNVIALIGERGREVNEFLERDLGPEGLARSVRRRGNQRPARVAATEGRDDRNRHCGVLPRSRPGCPWLLMDSLTRFAMAPREIGLAAGEPPATRGYPPSVFALLPRLVERAGRNQDGSITGLLLGPGRGRRHQRADQRCGARPAGRTSHPLSEARPLGSHYPAIDVLASISRLMTTIAPPEQLEAAKVIRELLATYQDHEDLISIGAYRRGSNPTVDAAITMHDEIKQYLQQGIAEASSTDAASTQLAQLAARCTAALQTTPPANNPTALAEPKT